MFGDDCSSHDGGSDALEALGEDMMGAVLGAMRSGKLPSDDSARSCAVRGFVHLCGLYNDGSTPLGTELVKMVEALVNPEDPWVKRLGIAERAALFMMVNQFRQGRAKHVREREAAKRDTGSGGVP
jgi:hypothetical protein